MIPHNKPTLGEEEESAALRVVRSGWLAEGPEVKAFEDEFCKYVGLSSGHAVAVSSGTAALFLALWSLGAQGKKVTYPAYACSALRNAVGMIEGEEHPVDIQAGTPNIEKKSLQSNSDIKIVPHMFGIPVDLTKINSLENVIEDCAQSLGAKINGQHVGIHGTLGIYSFYATKLMTSGGQGGMIVSKDVSLVEKIRDYREFDYRRDDKKRFNFQMTDLHAAIGREQLKKLPKFLIRRENIFNKYKKEGLDLLDINHDDSKFLSPVRYRAIMKTKNPSKIIESLDSIGVKAVIPTEDWELLGNKDSFPNALDLTKETVSLPIYPSLTDENVDMIITCIKQKL